MAMDETRQGDTLDTLRIGLVATDPLRIEGLQALFPDGSGVEMVPLSVPGALDASGVSLILVDADCTEHIFELLAAFRRTRPHLRVVVMGRPEDHEHIQRMIGAGAKGYLAHTAKETEVRLAIEVVRDGSVWAPRRVMSRLVESSEQQQERQELRPKFTGRELQVLRLLAAGHPNKMIAEELGIDVITVKSYVGSLMRKVGVENRISLSVQAVVRNLLTT